jgi:hypothetical protein
MTQQVVLLLPAKVAEFRRRALYEQWATTIRSAAPESEWRSPDWKAELRRELDTAGEGQVRDSLGKFGIRTFQIVSSFTPMWAAFQGNQNAPA